MGRQRGPEQQRDERHDQEVLNKNEQKEDKTNQRRKQKKRHEKHPESVVFIALFLVIF